MLRTLLGLSPKVDLTKMITDGALILDVRTPDEFRQGHVKGSMNIPLDRLPQDLKRLGKQQPIITCCRSGMRSGIAASLLAQHGFSVHNGGPWMNVQSHLPK